MLFCFSRLEGRSVFDNDRLARFGAVWISVYVSICYDGAHRGTGDGARRPQIGGKSAADRRGWDGSKKTFLNLCIVYAWRIYAGKSDIRIHVFKKTERASKSNRANVAVSRPVAGLRLHYA
jgi:hypothetical protein